MRKVQGINSLLSYLDTVGYPLTEPQVNSLITDKKLPHVRYGHTIVFYLDHVDWWVRQQRRKNI